MVPDIYEQAIQRPGTPAPRAMTGCEPIVGGVEVMICYCVQEVRRCGSNSDRNDEEYGDLVVYIINLRNAGIALRALLTLAVKSRHHRRKCNHFIVSGILPSAFASMLVSITPVESSRELKLHYYSAPDQADPMLSCFPGHRHSR